MLQSTVRLAPTGSVNGWRAHGAPTPPGAMSTPGDHASPCSSAYDRTAEAKRASRASPSTLVPAGVAQRATTVSSGAAIAASRGTSPGASSGPSRGIR
jgi:hypothetical protein